MEEIREEELVYSRDQHNPSALIEARPVEKIIRRLAEVEHLHLRGPNGLFVTIRTTGEHPFYAYDRGWTPLKELTPEEWVLTDSGEWARIEEIYRTGELEVVHNLRVAEHHTYFIREEGWGWTAWAHNISICYDPGQGPAMPSGRGKYISDSVQAANSLRNGRSSRPEVALRVR